MSTYRNKFFSVVCAMLMIVMIFQNVSAEDEYNTGEDMDIFIDSFGNEHQVWRELVNGTYQVFYGYQIVDTEYNTNSASYINQTINNVIFDNGYLSIVNCTVNGNIIITQGNVLLQDCNIIGNVNIDLGRIQITNCEIIGNLDAKNADLEIRYSRINGYLYPKQSSFEDYSEIIIGNDIIGNVIIKGGTCYVVGNIIHSNLDINFPSNIQLTLDNNVTGHIKLNGNTEGFEGYQLTNSTMDVLYPQCTVDSMTGLGYVAWLENNFDLYYMGTQDFVTWSEPIFIGSITATGNPELNLVASNGLLTITWENGGFRTLNADIDGDFIPDIEDTSPLEYNLTPGDSSFIPDAVAIDINLRISVAIDYLDNATMKPSISLANTPVIHGSVGQFVNITTTCNQSFTAFIKFQYDESSINEDFLESYFRGYWEVDNAWRILKNETVGEDTGVDTENDIVWAITNHFSTFGVFESSLVDSDGDGLTDAEEINAAGKTPDIISTFSDGTNSKTISLNAGIPETVYIDIPVTDGAIYRASTGEMQIEGLGYRTLNKITDTNEYNSASPIIQIDSEDTIHLVWIDDRAGVPELYYKRSFDYGASWSTERVIYTGVNNIDHVKLVVDDNNIAITWIEWLGFPHLYVSSSTDYGAIWSTPYLVGTADNPSLDLENGDIYLACRQWTTGGPDFFTTMKIIWSSNGMDLTEAYVHPFNTPSGYPVSGEPIIYVDGLEIHVAIEDYTYYDQPNIYYYHSFDLGYSWDNYGVITQYHSDIGPQEMQLIKNGENLLLFWPDNRDGTFKLFYKELSGDIWGEDICLTSFNSVMHPDICVDENGVFHITWEEIGTSEESYIIYRQYDTTLTEQLFNESYANSMGDFGHPSGALDSYGNFYIMFNEYTDTSEDYDLAFSHVIFPSSVQVDVGSSEIIEWQHQNPLFGAESISDFSTSVNYYLVETGISTGTVSVPITISSTIGGEIVLSNPYVEMYVSDTDPLDSDTDDDLLSDGDEILLYGSDPRDIDTDDDLISDYDEVVGTYHGYITDPTDADTDSDGINDGIEANVLSRTDIEIESFSGGATNLELIFTEPGTATVTFDLPVHGDAVEYVVGADLLLEGKSYIETDRTGYDIRMDMNDHLVTWADNRNGDYDIYVYDYLSYTETQITLNSKDQVEPAIYNEKLIWTDYRDDNEGKWIETYSDDGNNGEIYWYDLSEDSDNDSIPNYLESPRLENDPALSRVTANIFDDFDASIYENNIVWTREENNQLDVLVSAIETSAESYIVSNSQLSRYNQFDPEIWENKVVWTDTRYGNRDIYMYDMATSTEKQITDDFECQDTPAISGNQIIWRDFRNSLSKGDICSYDLDYGTEQFITNTPTIIESCPEFWNNNVIWTSYDDNQFDVQMYNWASISTFTSPSSNQAYPCAYNSMIGWLDYSGIKPTLCLKFTGMNPTASILSITPNPASKYQQINFDGEATGGNIIEYRWYSDIDGLIGTTTPFSTTLSQGSHTISFAVRSDDGLWSPICNYQFNPLIVGNDKPVASINSIPTSPVLKDASMLFQGSGTDADGEIVGYRWVSSLDGLFETTATATTTSLSSGEHRIYFSVMDDANEWSNIVEYPELLIVKENLQSSGWITQNEIWHSDYPKEMTVELTASPLSSFLVSINNTTPDFVSNSQKYTYIGFLTSVEITELSGTGTYLISDGVLRKDYSSQIGNNGVLWKSDGAREVTVKVSATQGSFAVNAMGTSRTVTTPGSYYYIGSTDEILIDNFDVGDNGEYLVMFGIIENFKGALGSNEVIWESEIPHEITLKVSAEAGSFKAYPTSGAITGRVIGEPGTYYYVGSSTEVRISDFVFPDSGTFEIKFGVAASYIGNIGSNDVVWESEQPHQITLKAIADFRYFHVRPTSTWSPRLVDDPGTYCFVGSSDEISISDFDDLTYTAGRYEISIGIENIFSGYIGGNEVIWESDSPLDVNMHIHSMFRELYVTPSGAAIVEVTEDEVYSHSGTLNNIAITGFEDQDQGRYTITLQGSTGIPLAFITGINPKHTIDEHDPVFFSGMGIDYDGTISSYEWSSDLVGILSNSPVFEYNLLRMGNHTITLKVTDNDGNEAFDSQLVSISYDDGAPRAFILSISPNPAVLGQVVTFAGQGVDDVGIERYRWTLLGPNDILSIASTFSTSSLPLGTHEIRFEVEDKSGTEDYVIATVTIVNTLIAPTININDFTSTFFERGEALVFSSQGADTDGFITCYEWTSDIDGLLYSGPNPSFSTSTLSSGHHIISLRALDNDNLWSTTDTTELNIAVMDLPLSYIDSVTQMPLRWDNNLPIPTTDEITLIGHGEVSAGGTITSYQWRSNIDGILGIGSSLTTETLSTGTHVIYFKVKDDTGRWSEEVGQVVVVKDNSQPHAAINTPSEGSDLLFWDAIRFDATTSYDDDNDILTYSWDFGDGTPIQYGAVCYHAYPNAATEIFTSSIFTVVLTVSDGLFSSTTSSEINVASTYQIPAPSVSLVSNIIVKGIYNDTIRYCEDSTVDLLGYDGRYGWEFDSLLINEHFINLRPSINFILKSYHFNEYDGIVTLTIEIHTSAPGVMCLSLINVQEMILVIDPTLSGWDTDGDAVGDGDEVFDCGTNPQDSDSDDDGLNDGIEINGWADFLNPSIILTSDPLIEDTDKDGFPDFNEYNYGTLPRFNDSDNDGVIDSTELYGMWNQISSGAWNTNYDDDGIFNNLRNSDSDDDGLLDGEEYRKCNPSTPYTDGDDLTDFEEVKYYKTSPKKIDTDSDEINDDDEIIFWNGISADGWSLDYDKDKICNILDRDSDGDKMNDGNEIAFWNLIGSNGWNHNPDSDGYVNIADYDSDNDGIGDGAEKVLWEVITATAWNNNSDDDEYVNIEDDDADDDGLNDGAELIMWNKISPIAWKDDFDDDGIICLEDDDSDDDLYLDGSDSFPYDPEEWGDWDNDGVGNNADKIPTNPAASQDRDGDGYPGNDEWHAGYNEANAPDELKEDKFPDDPDEWFDNEPDGIGDNADTDDDNDGMSDEWESRNPLYLNPLINDANEDPDNDGLSNYNEYIQDSNATNKYSDNDSLDDYEEFILETNPNVDAEMVNLTYRVIDVFPDSDQDGGRIVTQVRKITREEREEHQPLFTDYGVIRCTDKPGKLLYPSSGCPEFVVMDNLQRHLYFDVDTSTDSSSIEFERIVSVTLNETYYRDTWSTVSISNDNNHYFVEIPPSTLINGLYNMCVKILYKEVYAGETTYSYEYYTAWHSVQILDSYKENFTFVQLTDTHIGEGFGYNGNVGDFLALINRINKLEKPDFVIITGDLTQNGKEKEVQYFKACLLRFEVPVFLTPGNHDHGGSSLNLGGSIDYYRAYLNPQFDSGSEGDLEDYSFNYGDYHFISFDSGYATNIAQDPAPCLSGLTTDQLDWMKSDYATAISEGKTHTFIFTHGPIVGHGGGATHDSIVLDAPDEDRDIPFVEWVNEDEMTVEAVFCGHTHEDHLFYGVESTESSMNNPPYDYYEIDYIPTNQIPLQFSERMTYYIETNTATKDW